ncbi:hypothetical protein [Desulfosediminicola sp.]|uniref:hypothetical protein n=1 Tax=Desulfosediminicola sp. TaxID=2886825 RepID=UPI003AF286FB
MTYLKLNRLTCRKTQEAIDEPYLRAIIGRHNDIVWGPQSLDDGESSPLDWDVTFWTRAEVQLWEHDRIKHDLINSLNINLEDPWFRFEEGEHVTRLAGRNAIYDLHYTLKRYNRPDNFRVRLHTLRCNDAQERRDEPYLLVNGNRIWSDENVRTGDTRDVNRTQEFSGNLTIELWDYDQARSDCFGTLNILADDIGSGIRETSHRFHKDRGIVGDASYTLSYEVEVLR